MLPPLFRRLITFIDAVPNFIRPNKDDIASRFVKVLGTVGIDAANKFLKPLKSAFTKLFGARSLLRNQLRTIPVPPSFTEKALPRLITR